MKIIHVLRVAGVAAALATFALPAGHLVLADEGPARNVDLKAVAASSNAFAFDLLARLRRQPGNLACSPLSVAAALTMAWGGARGETAAQMKNVLHLEGSPGDAMEAARQLVASFEDPAKQLTLRVANRLFGEASFGFDPGFVDRAGAPLERLDFRHDAEAARAHINKWVAEQTNDRIKDLLPPSSIRPTTRLVLANAVYFLARWALPFSADKTTPAPFHTSKGAAHDVATMHRSGQLAYAHADGVALVELPYRGGEAVMTIVLPDAVDGLGAVEEHLTGAVFAGWLAALAPTEVELALPRLVIDPPSPIALGDALAEMGMPLAFDTSHADFSGMVAPGGKERLAISQVFHKAFVKVDEEGTEAAAATGMTMEPTMMHLPRPALSFHADHPFLFFLRDPRSGVILFAGRVADPGKARPASD